MVFFADEPAVLAMEMSAVISPCGTWRYELRRIWDRSLPVLVVDMLNPSKASHLINDPTVFRLIGFAKRWGFGGLLIVNFYAFRTSKPDELAAAGWPQGPENEKYTLRAMREARAGAGWMLAAWGNHGQDRANFFIQRCRAEGVELRCLGLTNSGAPKHPLARGKHRVPDDFEPIPFGAT